MSKHTAHPRKTLATRSAAFNAWLDNFVTYANANLAKCRVSWQVT